MSTEVCLDINGETYKIAPKNVPINTTLNTFIRKYAKLSGTKSMCWEGGCGACVVTVKFQNQIRPVNSCLQNVYSCHGWEITTIEGLGSKQQGMHKIQSLLANFNGTQCGYCSPGMVMNMHSLMEINHGKVTMEEVESSFGGNICRCTGYRPILDAFKSLAIDADEKLLSACHDIEDLNIAKTCKKTGLPCSSNCKNDTKLSLKPLVFTFANGKQWHKVYNVKEIFNIFSVIGSKQYMLVAGNTAHGVYRRSPDIQVFIDITSVEKLCGHKFSSDGFLEIGGNVTLTGLLKILTETSETKPCFRYLIESIKHINLVANEPIRSNGTVAGNLMIKYYHNEFPSDIFILMEGVGATLNIAKCEKTVTKKSLQEFLKLDMKKRLIKSFKFPPLDIKKIKFKTYKIMPRSQNSQAYVNAAFLIENAVNITSARICFGGINPNFIHAVNTEKFLIGKNLHANETLRGALECLRNELVPDIIPTGASPEYRKNLVLSLFYKFVINTAPSNIVANHIQSGGEILIRELSSGSQIFDTYEKNWPLTKSIPKIEADVQCTGEAKYINDIPSMPNELFGAFVLADKVHEKILKIDASAALNIPGVVAFFSAKDIPGKNTFMVENYLFVEEPEEIFCSFEVKFYGQVLGIILSESPELSIAASKMVRVEYSNDNKKKILPTIKEVFANNATDRIHVRKEFCKEAEEKGSDSVHKISGKFEIEGQYHFTLETHSAVVVPNEDGLDVYAATQWIDLTQIAIAETLNIPNNLVNMNVRRLGGAFGCKISRGNQVACATALAAHLLKRPVRFVMSMETNMTTVGKRLGLISNYSLDVDENGKITKLKNEFSEDYGSSSNEPAYLSTRFFTNCYISKSWEVIFNMVITDSPSNTWFRGPGAIEGHAMAEHIMEHIAHITKKDPVQVRLENLPENDEMRKILIDFAASVEYYQRKKIIDKFNRSNRWTKRGIAIVPMKFHIEYFGSMNATVSVYHRDGTVSVAHGGIEMGQGLNTKVAQTAAHILGIPLDKISVKPTNNFTAPNAIVTGASIGSEISCYAVQKACEELMLRLKPIRDNNPTFSWEKIVKTAFDQSIDLSSTYFYKSDELKEYYVYGAACCEMEVDILSGNYLIKRVDIMEDVGESMSPSVDIGQIEGAFVIGLGYWLTEKLIYDKETGKLLNNRSWTYKVPGARDIPIDFRIKFLQNSSNPFGVLRSKAVGEPAICLSIVSIFALRHALNSARNDSGLDEFLMLGAPTTVEKIFLSAKNSVGQYTLN